MRRISPSAAHRDVVTLQFRVYCGQWKSVSGAGRPWQGPARRNFDKGVSRRLISRNSMRCRLVLRSYPFGYETLLRVLNDIPGGDVIADTEHSGIMADPSLPDFRPRIEMRGTRLVVAGP